jgi:hypothetical protein
MKMEEKYIIRSKIFADDNINGQLFWIQYINVNNENELRR